jgi:hypothetical protein
MQAVRFSDALVMYGFTNMELLGNVVCMLLGLVARGSGVVACTDRGLKVVAACRS